MMTPRELSRWLDDYDAADIIEGGEVDLCGVEWDRCYTSDLPRAVRTAERIYRGEIIPMPGLREFRPRPFFQVNIPLPFLLWLVLLRLAFRISHRSLLGRKVDFQRRVGNTLDQILSRGDENVLAVSHGILMISMREALLERGFQGPRFGTPAYGKLYLFER